MRPNGTRVYVTHKMYEAAIYAVESLAANKINMRDVAHNLPHLKAFIDSCEEEPVFRYYDYHEYWSTHDE